MAYIDAAEGNAAYTYATPSAAAGASKLHFDIFNASGSGVVVGIRGIWAIQKTDVAVTGVVAARFDLYRTSAVGTGGTSWNWKSATVDVAGGTLVPFDTLNGSSNPSQLTARHLPTGGATISQWVFPTYSFPEETNTAPHLTQYQNLMPLLPHAQMFRIQEGEGILVKQGTVASVGSVHFLVALVIGDK